MLEIPLFPEKDLRSPVFWANLTATERVVINQGGTWSGKSYSILMVLFTIAVCKPNYVITIISNTVTKLKEDALRISKEIIQKNPVLQNSISHYNSTDRIYTFLNGSIMEFKSFENAEQAKGGKRHILYVNEATRINYQIFFEAELRTSVRTFVDYNPTATFWVHHQVLNNKAEYTSVKVIRSWHIHNPYLSADQRARIENIQDKELHKVYARGLTGILKGTIFPNWVEVPTEDFTFSDGVMWYADWGYTNDPTAAGRYYQFPDGHPQFDFLVDELTYTPGIPIPALAQVMYDNGYKEGQLMYCDHDPGQISELRQQNPVIHAYPQLKPEGIIMSRILWMRNKRVAYTKRSVNIAIEKVNYRFMEIEGILTNQPVDEYNHHMDGFVGAAYTHALRTGTT
jgi:phage terminase large subunit